MSDFSQGPGWWQASDGKWYPPEQAPGGQPAPAPGAPQGFGADAGYGAAPGYGAPAPVGPVTATEPFGYAWNKYSANVGPLIAAVAAFIGVMIVVQIIAWLIQQGSSSFLLNLIVGVGSIFVMLVVQLGIIRVALKVVNGQPVTTDGVFSGEGAGEFLIAALLLSLPYLLCYLPGVIVAFFGGWFGFFIVDRNEGAIDSIKSSFKLVSENIGTVLVFSILAAVIIFAGFCFCLVGSFVAMPVVIIAQAYLYRRLTGGAVAA